MATTGRKKYGRPERHGKKSCGNPSQKGAGRFERGAGETQEKTEPEDNRMGGDKGQRDR